MINTRRQIVKIQLSPSFPSRIFHWSHSIADSRRGWPQSRRTRQRLIATPLCMSNWIHKGGSMMQLKRNRIHVCWYFPCARVRSKNLISRYWRRSGRTQSNCSLARALLKFNFLAFLPDDCVLEMTVYLWIAALLCGKLASSAEMHSCFVLR